MQVNTRYTNSTKGTSSLRHRHQRMPLSWSLCTLCLLMCQLRESYSRQFSSLLLCSCDVFQVLTHSLPLENSWWKCEIWKSFGLFVFFFTLARERIFIKTHCLEIRYRTKKYTLCGYMCTLFRPEKGLINSLCWFFTNALGLILFQVMVFCKITFSISAWKRV